MATFVQIEPDAFNANFGTVADEIRELRVGASIDRQALLNHRVRRPVRGIQIKSDTYATIQVRRADGTAIPLFDSAAAGEMGKGFKNSNFLIQSVQEQRAEKQQVIMTFGAPYIFFFGEQPRMIAVSGVLLNTEDFNWRAEWWENYEQHLRGTQCVRTRSRVYLSWDDIVVEGYIIQATASEDSSTQNLVQFQFQMFLTNYQNISHIGNPNAHWHGKSIFLDPNKVDIPGQVSTTLSVREANIRDEALASGQGKNSLFDYLKKGQIADAGTRLVELHGQVVDMLSLAGQFVSGRNIRVPRGFEGAAAFDQEVQLSLASIPGADQVIHGDADRVVRFKTGGLNLVKEFRVALSSKFGPARTGLPLSDNDDEFIDTTVIDETSIPNIDNLFDEQKTTDKEAYFHVRDMFEDFGLKIEPPSELTQLFKRVGFGIVSVAVGMNVADSSKARTALNTVGSLF